jgi:hypothetical protein
VKKVIREEEKERERGEREREREQGELMCFGSLNNEW